MLDATTHFDGDSTGEPSDEVTLTMRRDEWAVLADSISDHIDGLRNDLEDDLSADRDRDEALVSWLSEAYSKIWHANVK